MKDDKSKELNRRSFLLKALGISGGIAGILVTIPVVTALIEPLARKTRTVWRPVGKVNDFKVGETVLVKFSDASPLPWSKENSQTASWLRRESENKFIAFSVNCAHLGCPVRWLPDAEIFMCPCHGGVYNKDGSYSAGPPPHDLDRYPARIHNDMVEILASPIPITTL